jgi:hypothetical protein
LFPSPGDKSGIKKRYFHHTEETLSRHPEFLDRALPSLGARLRTTADAVAELAAAAAVTAIAEWGRPAADITHLTTRAGCFAEGHRLSAKPLRLSAKHLPSAALGKAASAKIRSAKPSLPATLPRARAALGNEKAPLTAGCR